MTQDSSHTRMIAIGSLALVRGFRLIGFEALADPDRKNISVLIDDLQRHQQRAFLVVEQHLANELRDIFRPIQQEGGDILMVELPAIHEPEKLDSYLSSKIEERLGSQVLNREVP